MKTKPLALLLGILLLSLGAQVQATVVDCGFFGNSGAIGNPGDELAFLQDNLPSFTADDGSSVDCSPLTAIPTTYLQKWNYLEEGGGAFAEDPGIGTYTIDPEDQDPNAEVTWDLAGTGFGLEYILVKDGSSGGPNGFQLYHLYGIGEDMALSGTADVTINDDKNISHISFFGSPAAVPEPSTALLTGIGMVGFGIWRWKRLKRLT